MRGQTKTEKTILGAEEAVREVYKARDTGQWAMVVELKITMVDERDQQPVKVVLSQIHHLIGTATCRSRY
ncbi:hypothetical protein RSOLAG1IB_02513 [Rhizoctonia solani AG-1 IB]|uniref:Uncharacterized protein n=1 Tax=Thanatephorus cucumeris (strain AG1-IB / isolate 7/3/14) TaxID=1108050 RepID=A0A0B7FLH1_THACB|nr:hypothetical protein RSOLAG1IB_02513 [Rhizoctonia solani AG-1 IB]